MSFPQLPSETLISIRQSLDQAYRQFSREYGEMIEMAFEPLLQFLIWFEQLLVESPWWLVLMVMAGIAMGATRSRNKTIAVTLALVVIGLFGMWDNTMRTLSMITVCTLLAIVFGIPIGILATQSPLARRLIEPTLDVMQTMPAFVYLIPVVMLLGIGKIPGLIAVVVYAIPPIIRLTALGIREVDSQILEASDAFGSTRWQRLTGVSLPMALPSIMAGINQTIMMALAMVVIASMIGVKGLGQPVLKSITNQYFTLGLMNGLAIVVLAVIFDRVSQSLGHRLALRLGRTKA